MVASTLGSRLIPAHNNLLQPTANPFCGLPSAELGRYHPRVAIDGVDGAGKTTLPDELAPVIEGAGRGVVRASIDGLGNVSI